MPNQVKESLKKLRSLQNKHVNTQLVFERMPETEKKKRKTVDIDEIFKRHALSLCPSFIPNVETQTMFKYFCENGDFDYKGIVQNNANIFKGLLVYGSVGTGKSLFFKIMHDVAKELVIQHAYQGMWFTSLTAPYIVNEYMRATSKDYTGSFNFKSLHKGTLYIDDLGTEELAFGRDNIITDLLFERHRNGSKTFITTNLTPSQLGDKYGFRIADRIPEFFNIIKMDGKSLREE